jgi:hypothetical protein
MHLRINVGHNKSVASRLLTVAPSPDRRFEADPGQQARTVRGALSRDTAAWSDPAEGRDRALSPTRLKRVVRRLGLGLGLLFPVFSLCARRSLLSSALCALHHFAKRFAAFARARFLIRL